MTLTQIKRAGLDGEALDRVFTVGASGTDHYTFQGEGLNGTVNDPTLYLTRGKTYRFEKGSSHPLRIQSTAGSSGTAYNTGVTNNGGTGTVIMEVQHDAPDILYYQCTSHPNMNGVLYITGALADGGVTTAKIAGSAVTTAKIADDAVTAAKIADNAINSDRLSNSAVSSAKLATNSVTTAKISDGNVTTAKLANDAVTADKIADNSVGAAQLAAGALTNTEVDSSAAIAGTKISPNFGSQNIVTTGDIGIGTTSPTAELEIFHATDPEVHLNINTHGDVGILRGDADGLTITGNGSSNQIRLKTNNAERMRINSSGQVAIGTTSPGDGNLTVKGTTNAYGGAGNSTVLVGAKLILEDDQGRRVSFWAPRTGEGAVGSITNHDFVIVCGNNEKARFSNNSGDFTISNGNLKLGTSGKGIDFSATTNAGGIASMGNELFDDYEEGTFTPTYGWNGAAQSGFSTSQNSGYYVKIGNLVHIEWWTNFSATPSAGNSLQLQLPFSAHNSGGYRGGITYSWSNITWNNNTSRSQGGRTHINSGASFMEVGFMSDVNGGNWNTSGITPSGMSNSASFQGSGSYFVPY